MKHEKTQEYSEVKIKRFAFEKLLDNKKLKLSI